MADNDVWNDWQGDTATLQLAYQISMQRLIEADSKMWQVPGLSLTAQAFPLTIALGSANHTSLERVIAGVLGMGVAVASIQLMERHMFHALCDVKLLEKLEAFGAMPPLVRREGMNSGVAVRGMAQWRSSLVWRTTLWGFVVVNLLAVVLVVVGR